MQVLSPRFRSEQYFVYERYSGKCFIKIYCGLYGDAMLVPIRMGTNVAARNQQKHLSRVFPQKREYISRGTHKH